MAEKIKQVCITFDVDYTDYYSGGQYDEMTYAFPPIQSVLTAFPDIKTTWFIRIDSQIEALFGVPDYIFKKHPKEIDWLRENGHEIGWHHHSYRKADAGWQQDTREEIICKDLQRFGKYATALNIQAVRMGWGFHTNKTMRIISELGFKTDSSAIPRPNYAWELSKKDWSCTLQQPYFPSVEDYRIAGANHLQIREVPINTVSLPLPTDTEEGVMRYINPSYRHPIFRDCIERYGFQSVTTIAHPYEFTPRESIHSLIAFDIDELKKNFAFLLENDVKFKTISDLKF